MMADKIIINFDVMDSDTFVERDTAFNVLVFFLWIEVYNSGIFF